MKITINIECDCIMEFKQHLKCLTEQIEDAQNKMRLDDDDEFPAQKSSANLFSDNNCYGTHSVEIK